MDQILLFALLGLGTGALIAGIGLGVVLSYRGSGVIDLATGAYAMIAGYLFLWLRTDSASPPLQTVPAMLVALAATIALGAVVELLVFRPLRTSSPLSKLVASLGVLLTRRRRSTSSPAVAAGSSRRCCPAAWWRSSAPRSRPIASGSRRSWCSRPRSSGRCTSWSRFGLATRAASESEASAMLAGLSPDRLALTNSVLATTVAGGMGILAAAVTQIDTVAIPLQVVPALGRCAVRPLPVLLDHVPRRACSSGWRSRCCTTRRRRAGSRPTAGSRFPASTRC